MPRKRRPPIVIKQIEGFSRQPDGTATFVDDFTGEVKPVLTGDARASAPNPLSGNEFDEIRRRAKVRKAKELLALTMPKLIPKPVSVDQYIKPNLPNQRPVATIKVKDKPDAVIYKPINPIRRGY